MGADQLGALDVPGAGEDDRARLVEEEGVLVEDGEGVEWVGTVGEPVLGDEVLPVEVLLLVVLQPRRVMTEAVE